MDALLTLSLKETLQALNDGQVSSLELTRAYLERIEQVTGVPIDLVSTSPDRDHTIMMRHPYVAD